jgi:hypothetical protein
MGCSCGRVDDNIRDYNNSDFIEVIRKKISDLLKFYRINDIEIITKNEFIVKKKTSWKKFINSKFQLLTLKNNSNSSQLFEDNKKINFAKAFLKFIKKNKLEKFISLPDINDELFYKLNNISLENLNLNAIKSLNADKPLILNSDKQAIFAFIKYDDFLNYKSYLKDIPSNDDTTVNIILFINEENSTEKISEANQNNNLFYTTNGKNSSLNLLFDGKLCLLYKNGEIVSYFKIVLLKFYEKISFKGPGINMEITQNRFTDLFLNKIIELEKISFKSSICNIETFTFENINKTNIIFPLNVKVNKEINIFEELEKDFFIAKRQKNNNKIIPIISQLCKEFNFRHEIKNEKFKFYSSLLQGFGKRKNLKFLLFTNESFAVENFNNLLQKLGCLCKNLNVYLLPDKEQKFEFFDANKYEIIKCCDLEQDKDNLIIILHRNTDTYAFNQIIQYINTTTKPFNKILINIDNDIFDDHLDSLEKAGWNNILQISEEIDDSILAHNNESLKRDEFVILITTADHRVRYSDVLSLKELIDQNKLIDNSSINDELYRTIKTEEISIVNTVVGHLNENKLSTNDSDSEKHFIRNTMKAYSSHCKYLSPRGINVSYIKVLSDNYKYYKNYKLNLSFPKAEDIEPELFVDDLGLCDKDRINMEIDFYNVKPIRPKDYCEECHNKLATGFYYCPVGQISLCVKCEAVKNNFKENIYYPFNLFYINCSRVELLDYIIEYNFDIFKLFQKEVIFSECVCFVCNKSITKQGGAGELAHLWLNVLDIPINENTSTMCDCCVTLITNINNFEKELNNTKSKLFEKLLEHDIDVNNLILKKIVYLNKK